MVDIDIKSEHGRFKFRIGAIIKQGDYVLVSYDSKDDFYYMPGGHVELGENTEHAVKREVKEELKCDVKIERLLAISQNIYTCDNLPAEEVVYYYIVTPQNLEVDFMDTSKKYDIDEIDKGVAKTSHLQWININSEKIILPIFLKDLLKQNAENKIVLTDTISNVYKID